MHASYKNKNLTQAKEHYCTKLFNSLPNDNFFLNSKHLQKTNVAKIMVLVSERVENIVGNQHFLLFPQKFSKGFF